MTNEQIQALMTMEHNGQRIKQHWFRRDEVAALIRKALEANGRVVLTRSEGELVAVTRQDDEGRILSIIWQKDK